MTEAAAVVVRGRAGGWAGLPRPGADRRAAGAESRAGGGVDRGWCSRSAGFGLTVLAQQTMGRTWRIGVDPEERTDLITHGVFGYVRNPIFTAMIAAQAGTTLLAPTWLAVIGLGLLVAGVD